MYFRIYIPPLPLLKEHREALGPEKVGREVINPKVSVINSEVEHSLLQILYVQRAVEPFCFAKYGVEGNFLERRALSFVEFEGDDVAILIEFCTGNDAGVFPDVARDIAAFRSLPGNL